MRYALKERPVRGTTASVNIVNTGANNLEVKKLEGFSAFHNFSSNVMAYVYGKRMELAMESSFHMKCGKTHHKVPTC